MKLTQKLRKLIYGYSNIILVDFDSVEEVFKEIEIMRSLSTIEGWIFRPNFAKGTEFVEYSNEDYQAIYAQWSLSFGWSDKYELLTGSSAKDVLSTYKKDYDKDLTPLFTKDEKASVVESTDYVFTIASDIASSKTVLTENQKTILLAMPKKVKLFVFKNTHISIRETKVLLIKSIMTNDSTFNPFTNVESIVPLTASLYNKNTSIDGQVTPRSLKSVKVRIPTSAKRMILQALISGYNTNNALVNFKKFQSYWKVLLKELTIGGNFNKTVVQYPEFFDVHELVYSNIKTNKSKIEQLRKEGLLAEAFLIEMNNIGEMIRSISFYLRNRVGSTYPTKQGLSPKKTIVISDISKIIKGEEFLKILSNANPKLLLQLKSILIDEKNLKSTYIKYIKSKRTSVSYVTDFPVPSLDKQMVKIVLKKVEEAYSLIKRKENKKLGKVFIDKSLKNKKVSFSGRVDTGTSTSGQYLSLGSKISIPEMAEEGKLIRYGVSWKARKNNPLSICIDPSVHFINGDIKGSVVNWQGDNDIIQRNSKILVSSSGDITDCSTDKFSTELVDIDGYELKKIGSTKFFTAIINYNAPSGDFKEIETYVFFNVLDRKDRVLGTRVSIALDQMDFSYEVNEAVSGQIGLLFDTEEGTVEVVKMAFNVGPYDSATNKSKFLNEILEVRGKLPNLYDSLLLAINEEQLSDRDVAKTVFDDEFDSSKLQSVLM